MTSIIDNLFPVFEWLCFGGLLVSTWLYNRDDISGPLTGAVASAAFIIYGYFAGMPAASITNVAFYAIHIRNLFSKLTQTENYNEQL